MTEARRGRSYLSSSVNLASRLEAATKQYGTPILLSGEMHSLLSAKVSRLPSSCRRRVALDGIAAECAGSRQLSRAAARPR